MARSTYIYLLYQKVDTRLKVIGAFTVKHEMNDWVKSHIGPGYLYRRLYDGAPGYESKLLIPEVYDE